MRKVTDFIISVNLLTKKITKDFFPLDHHYFKAALPTEIKLLDKPIKKMKIKSDVILMQPD